MSEYYIKQPDTDHARGPLSLEQLMSLAESGMATEETLLYDEISEKWKPISSYPELIPVLFPEKRTLVLNREEVAPTEKEVTYEVASGNKNPDVSAENILAAAAGNTKETRHIGRVKNSIEKAAGLAIPGIGLVLLLNAVALIYPGIPTIIDSVQNQSILMSFKNPLILMGVTHLVISALVFMGVTTLFPFVRVLASITFGFTTYLFWAWDNPLLIIAGALMSIGLFISTVSLRYGWMLLSLMMGVIGAVVLAYAGISGALTY